MQKGCHCDGVYANIGGLIIKKLNTNSAHTVVYGEIANQQLPSLKGMPSPAIAMEMIKCAIFISYFPFLS